MCSPTLSLRSPCGAGKVRRIGRAGWCRSPNPACGFLITLPARFSADGQAGRCPHDFLIPAAAAGRAAGMLAHGGHCMPGPVASSTAENEQPGKRENQAEGDGKEQRKAHHVSVTPRSHRSGYCRPRPRDCRAYPAPLWSSSAGRTCSNECPRVQDDRPGSDHRAPGE